MLLTCCLGQPPPPPQHKITCPEMSMVSRLRNPGSNQHRTGRKVSTSQSLHFAVFLTASAQPVSLNFHDPCNGGRNTIYILLVFTSSSTLSFVPPASFSQLCVRGGLMESSGGVDTQRSAHQSTLLLGGGDQGMHRVGCVEEGVACAGAAVAAPAPPASQANHHCLHHQKAFMKHPGEYILALRGGAGGASSSEICPPAPDIWSMLAGPDTVYVIQP